MLEVLVSPFELNVDVDIVGSIVPIGVTSVVTGVDCCSVDEDNNVVDVSWLVVRSCVVLDPNDVVSDLSSGDVCVKRVVCGWDVEGEPEETSVFVGEMYVVAV